MEKIALMGTLSKSRRWIKKTDYQKLYDFIMMEVQANPGIKLHELLDAATAKLFKQLPNFYSLLLHVKHDMEARGIIDTNFDHMRNQVIRPGTEVKIMNIGVGTTRLASFG